MSSQEQCSKLDNLTVHVFFRRIPPDLWSAANFAQHPSAFDMQDFISGLKKINKAGGAPIHCRAGVVLACLKSKSGQEEFKLATETLATRVSQEMAGMTALRYQQVVQKSMLESRIEAPKRKHEGGHGDQELATVARRKVRFGKMDRSRFWTLKSGRTVEDVLFEASLMKGASTKIRSFTIDTHCPETEKLFDILEWLEIEQAKAVKDFSLPLLPMSTAKYINDLRKAVLERKPAWEVPIPETDQKSCRLAQTTFDTWQDLYRKHPSPFGVEDLSEAYWGRNSWPLLMKFLDELPAIFMIDGEKTGIDSSRRRNQSRQLEPDGTIHRKQFGRRFDLIARDVLARKDWMLVERMKGWDPQSTKFLQESGVDLFRETHTIMSHRLQETVNNAFYDRARFFGIYSGDRGFQAMELRPARYRSYVSFFHQYPAYDLPVEERDMKQQAKGLAHLLRIRRFFFIQQCMLNTIALYQAPSKEGGGQVGDSDNDEEDDASYLYEEERVHFDANINLASSP
ncbi:hypothetical protein BGW38_002049 [Lunasporangiospora selenospora]|uniref:Uncharacterized protein n=1 Tax=Lunasporangiospora selenospora TaxID=979761 RepID=A0A9P6KDT3_9FUNG|nr:hypothetical protein BGW38_002049 [Lunasporangiospora selenospora]